MEMKNSRQKPSWSHDSALLLVEGVGVTLPVQGQQRGEGNKIANGCIHSDPTICIIHALIYNKRHTF